MLVFVLMILAILNVFSHFTQICHVQNVLYLTLEGYLLDTQEICFEVGFCALLASIYPHVLHICLCWVMLLLILSTLLHCHYSFSFFPCWNLFITYQFICTFWYILFISVPIGLFNRLWDPLSSSNLPHSTFSLSSRTQIQNTSSFLLDVCTWNKFNLPSTKSCWLTSPKLSHTDHNSNSAG